MKSFLLPILLVGCLVIVGCDEKKENNTSNGSSDVDNKNEAKALNLHSNLTTKNKGDPKNIEKNVLEEAHRNYQASYNEYVRCLRESGPQTMETLQALTVYQKNYQIYQMLLKAESKK